MLKERYPLFQDIFFYKDSADFNAKNTWENREFIFRKLTYGNRVLTNSLDSIFSRKDIDFFGEQLQAMTKNKQWEKAFKKSVLVDSAEHIDYRRIKYTVWRYSLPLFSSERSHAIIVRSFFCGMLCGGGAYYIYRKSYNDNWILVRTINEWGE